MRFHFWVNSLFKCIVTGAVRSKGAELLKLSYRLYLSVACISLSQQQEQVRVNVSEPAEYLYALLLIYYHGVANTLC